MIVAEISVFRVLLPVPGPLELEILEAVFVLVKVSLLAVLVMSVLPARLVLVCVFQVVSWPSRL